jgi:uncharacterized protein (TIGR02996 family)
MPTDTDMRSAFISDIIEHPEDDTPRLIFADWLDDHGEPERAEFIRVQCELQQPFRGGPVAVERCNQLVAREHEIMSMARGGVPIWADWAGPAVRCLSSPNGFVGANERILFRRGFVAEIHCQTAAWMEHGKRIAREHPLEVVWLTDREPHNLHNYFVWPDEFQSSYGIPGSIFARLPPPDIYFSREAAFDRLSIACLAWAKQKTDKRNSC